MTRDSAFVPPQGDDLSPLPPMPPLPPKSDPEARAAWFSELVGRRNDRRGPRPTPRDGRTRMFVAGSPEERHWDAELRALGLTDEGVARQNWRRQVYRFAQDMTAQAAATAAAASAPAETGTDPLAHHLEREVTRLRDRARRDRAIADSHDAAAAEAETRLVEHLRAQRGSA